MREGLKNIATGIKDVKNLARIFRKYFENNKLEKNEIYIYIYIYIHIYIVEHKVCSVSSEPTQSSSRRVLSLKDSSVLLTTEW